MPSDSNLNWRAFSILNTTFWQRIPLVNLTRELRPHIQKEMFEKMEKNPLDDPNFVNPVHDPHRVRCEELDVDIDELTEFHDRWIAKQNARTEAAEELIPPKASDSSEETVG